MAEHGGGGGGGGGGGEGQGGWPPQVAPLQGLQFQAANSRCFCCLKQIVRTGNLSFISSTVFLHGDVCYSSVLVT